MKPEHEDATLIAGLPATHFSGRVAVITGVGAGIGKAAAMLFASHGAYVVGIDKDAERGGSAIDAVCAEFGSESATFESADVGDLESITTAANRILEDRPVIDVLFNNAGILGEFGRRLADFDVNEWRELVDTNLSGPLYGTLAFLPGLKRSSRPAVVHNSSIDGVLGNAHVSLYSISKGGLTPMTHVMAREFARYGIRVNCILPGGIDTAMTSSTLSESTWAELERATPMHRRGTAMEVAKVAMFLCSEDASYLNGVTLPVDLGRTGLTQGTLFWDLEADD